MRRHKVEGDLGIAIWLGAQHRSGGLGIDRWFVDTQTFAKITHPQVILIELLTAGQRAPWDHFMDVRSEEHTSELKSLMRTSYAVSCLTTQNSNHFTYNPILISLTHTVTITLIYSLP